MSDGADSAVRPLDLSRLLTTLARHGVDYVVIGGVAAQVHGHRRTTMDLDLVPAPAPSNLRRLFSALEELEARPRDTAMGAAQIPVTDPERLGVAAIVPPLSTRHGQLHIVNEPKGARPFDDLREAALVVELEEIEVPIVSLDDLLRMKRASGRRADLEDIAALTAEESRESD
jgi:predicted nucleotidyltransferase